jgi:hypothetical protein
MLTDEILMTTNYPAPLFRKTTTGKYREFFPAFFDAPAEKTCPRQPAQISTFPGQNAAPTSQFPSSFFLFP